MSGLVRAAEDSSVSPGLLGFLVVALLGVATWLLLRSMTRHLRRVDVSASARGGPQPATSGPAEAQAQAREDDKKVDEGGDRA
jgi:hypothetical protein